MRYFIYPAGVNGRVIQEALKVYEPQNNAILIDDAFREHNLEFLVCNICDDDRVLVASKWNYTYFASKLKELSIHNVINGIEYLGKQINRDIQARRAKGKKSIGFALQCEMIIKNFYGIDRDLEELGYCVVYIAGTREIYERYKTSLCVFASDALLEEIEGLDLMVVTAGEPVNPVIPSLNLTHGFQGTLHYPFMSYTQADRDFLCYAARRNTYVSCGGEKIYRGYENFFALCGLENRAVKLGYLHLTQAFKSYEAFCKAHQLKEDVVVIGFSFLVLEDWIKALIEGLLEAGKKVFIMAHPLYRAQVHSEVIPFYAGHPNFLQERDFANRNAVFARSLCLITDSSSVGYTYPLITGKRCIVYTQNREIYWTKQWGDEHYFDARLHVLCSSVSEVLESIDAICAQAEEFKASIVEYREHECLHFYDAREKHLEFIEHLLLD